MNVLKTYKQFINEAKDDGYSIVYRGGTINPKQEYAWVSDDEGFAEEYGNVKKYKIPKNLNFLQGGLDTAIELITLYDEDLDIEDAENSDLWFEPTDDFIDFLKSKGYDGFVHGEEGENICIFDKTKLKPITESKKDDIIELIKNGFDKDGYIIKSNKNKVKAKKYFNSLTDDERGWLEDLKINGYDAWDSLVMLANPEKEL